MTEIRYWLEDFTPGRVFHHAPREITSSEIIEFAREFDPQPFHLSEEAGKASILGGLAASGWHTCSIAMRLYFDTFLQYTAGEGAPGVDFNEWRKPVLAGDTLGGTITVIEARPLRSRPGLGMVRLRHELVNQRGEVVLVMEHPFMVRMREGSPRMKVRDLLTQGEPVEIGRYEFTTENIIAFARKFDPQYFHLDPERAKHSVLGGHCASGWHVSAAMMKCNVEAIEREVAARGETPPKFGPSPGFKNLKWLKPAYAGDTITYLMRFTGDEPIPNRPGRNLVRLGYEGINQRGELVYSADCTVVEFD